MNQLRTGFTIRPQGLYKEEVKEYTHEKTGGENIELHHRNLIRGIRLAEPLKCDPTLGYYGVVACQMGVLSYRKRQYLAWDKARERIIRA